MKYFMYNSIVINYLYTLDKNKFSCSDIIYIYIYICKDQVRLGFRIRMDLSPNDTNNKFIECGRES